MIDGDAFAARFGLEASQVRAAGAGEGASVPWYIGAVGAIGGWLGGLLLFAALGTLVDFDNQAALGGLGGLLLGCGVVLVRRAAPGMGRHFGLSLVFTGEIAMLGAVTIATESVTAVAVLAVALAAVAVPLVRNGLHQFLAVAGAAGLVAASLAVERVVGAGDLMILASVPLGMALLLRPPRLLDATAAACALLLAPPAMIALAQEFGEAAPLLPGWSGRAIYALALGGVLRRAGWPVLAAAVLAAAALPPGMLAALLLLACGWALGSGLLAGLGVAAELFFMSRFYYDLSATLLVKSGVLGGVGLLLLGLWLWLRRRP